MGSTALQIIQGATYELNCPTPATIVGNTDTLALQLHYLFLATGQELRSARLWPQLKKRYTIRLEAQRGQYQLPLDFYCALPGTSWDQGNRWQMQGPLADSSFDLRTYGYVTIENRKAYRVFGPDITTGDGLGQFQIDPIPGAGDAGTPITFEYISKSWLMPALWVSGGTVTATSYCFSGGNIYNHSSGTTCGTVPPNMADGVGQDGGVFWLALTTPAWLTATPYAPGDYVTNGGNLYQCSTGGVSSAGPSGTGSALITDGTVSWYYRSAASWTAETAFAYGAHIKISSQYYRSVTPGNQANQTSISGKVQPTWTPTTVSDGTITWTYRPQAYEALIADTDLCGFDDEVMRAGIKFRFLRARGLDYEDIKREYELLKSAAVGRWNNGMVISMAGGYGMYPSANIPDGNFGL